MQADRLNDRALIRVSGPEAREFLQGLVTNDVSRLDGGAVYAALLSPQGKYLADFLMVTDGDGVLLDTAKALAPALVQRLSMYKLRAKVEIAPDDRAVLAGLGDVPEGAFADPRHPALGWRLYGEPGGEPAGIDRDAIRVEHMIPAAERELVANDSYILEMGFERLNGVDFRKGCYVGQEVTARMKHKTELRKGLARVRIEGTAPPGTEITSDGKPAGRLGTQAGGHALAYLRFDRAEGEMQAGDARLWLDERAV